mgnify:CR=1 FL=1
MPFDEISQLNYYKYKVDRIEFFIKKMINPFSFVIDLIKIQFNPPNLSQIPNIIPGKLGSNINRLQQGEQTRSRTVFSYLF